MTNTDEARRAVQETIEQLGGIDIVLSNAVSAIKMPLS
jgi:NAD(P)-dependent dehydrogenase (short-subunit alcohol dehydrogenase family)